MSDAMAKATSPATQVPEDAHHVKFEAPEAVVNNDEQGNKDVPEAVDNDEQGNRDVPEAVDNVVAETPKQPEGLARLGHTPRA